MTGHILQDCLYAAEHVAATEFVIGATFVALGAKTMDIILGLLIGNILAVLSWTLITTPIAVETRLSLYTYLNKIAGDSMSKLYNWANVIIFTVISAAMVTVSASAVRFAFDIPAQLNWYLWWSCLLRFMDSMRCPNFRGYVRRGCLLCLRVVLWS